MNVLSLFATPLIVSNYECDEQTYNFLDSAGMTSDWSASYGNKSVNTYILDELICINLSKHILQTAKTVMTEMLGFDIEDVQFTQSWISHKNPGEHHTKHSHANSIISGVYYFQNDMLQLCRRRRRCMQVYPPSEHPLGALGRHDLLSTGPYHRTSSLGDTLDLDA